MACLDRDVQVTCLVKRWSHHTTSGGYDRLGIAVGANIIKRELPKGTLGWVAQKFWRRYTNTSSYLIDYQFGDWLAEIGILTTNFLRSPDVLHVLYGDEQLDLLLRWRALLRSRLVVSFHLPADRVSSRFEVIQAGLGKNIDAAIVLARNEISRFEKWIGAEKVIWVPHGIDTERFHPGNRKPGDHRIRLLFVGDHMRDWNVIHRVIDEARYLDLPVDFHVVTRDHFLSHFTGCSNVTFHSGICETALIQLYQDSDALLVPLLNATANNAILESLACGTPVISTLVGGIPDYVTKKCGWLFPRGEVGPIMVLIRQLCANKAITDSRRRAARLQALRFDWREVAKRMSVIYSAVASGHSPLKAMSEFDRQANSQ
jgi:glycosyltransferase involved in cell wall biosynthesis